MQVIVWVDPVDGTKEFTEGKCQQSSFNTNFTIVVYDWIELVY